MGALSLASLDPSILPRTELCSVTLAFGNAVVHSGFNFHNAHSEPLEVILYLRYTQRLCKLMPTTKDRRKGAGPCLLRIQQLALLLNMFWNMSKQRIFWRRPEKVK